MFEVFVTDKFLTSVLNDSCRIYCSENRYNNEISFHLKNETTTMSGDPEQIDPVLLSLYFLFSNNFKGGLFSFPFLISPSFQMSLLTLPMSFSRFSSIGFTTFLTWFPSTLVHSFSLRAFSVCLYIFHIFV